MVLETSAGLNVEAIGAALSRREFQLVLAAGGDGEAIEMTAVVVLVVNAGMLGAAPFRFAPNIAIDDGWLDIVIYRPRTMAQRAGVLWRIFRQRADGSNMVQRKARSVEIKAPDVQWYEVDGEVHRGNVLRAEIVPGGVRVVA